MTLPVIEFDAQDEGASSPTYDIPIITAGALVANTLLRFCGTGSVSNSFVNQTVPASGNTWADMLFVEDTAGADVDLNKIDPNEVSQGYMMFTWFASANGTDFATKARFTMWDDTDHDSNAVECFVGTTNHTSPFFKARGQTVNTAPARWWAEANDATLHALDTTGVIPCGDATGNEENAVLEGDTNYLEASVLNIESTAQFLSLDASIPDDATLGVDAVNIVATIRFTYV